MVTARLFGSMDDLPGLLFYGAWVWRIGLGLLVLAVVAAAILDHRRRARARTRATLAAVDRGSETDGVIRGRLGGDDRGVLAATLTIEGTQRHVAHWSADTLWVE